jgi:hypothetical protein
MTCNHCGNDHPSMNPVRRWWRRRAALRLCTSQSAAGEAQSWAEARWVLEGLLGHPVCDALMEDFHRKAAERGWLR